jgi:glycine oxidase
VNRAGPATGSGAASIAIAGGGIIGLSIGWRLAQRGFQVSVFDRGSMGGEASWAGAGMLAPGGEVDEPSELASLAVESRSLYGPFVRELEEASGFAIDFQECGAFDLAYSAAEREALENRATRQGEIGIKSNAIEASELLAKFPRIRAERLFGGRFYPNDAIVNPRDVVLALCAACRKRGVALLQNCSVEEAFAENDRIVVRTVKEQESYQALIIAAGAWSDAIRAGIAPLPTAVPIKGHLIGYQQPAQTCPAILRHGHTYLLQRASGLLIAGSSVERVGFNRLIEPAIVADLQARAALVLPHLSRETPAEIWTGFRPASDTLHAGRWQSDSLYLAYGHYRNGILLAPVTARKLADEISANLQTR